MEGKLWCREDLAEALSWKGDPLLDKFPCVALTVLAHPEYVQRPNRKVGSAYTIRTLEGTDFPMVH